MKNVLISVSNMNEVFLTMSSIGKKNNSCDDGEDETRSLYVDKT